MDRQLKLMAKCGKSRKDPHVCTNLHNLLAKTGKMLDVKISSIPLWIRYSRKRPQQALVNYPILRMNDWVDTIFRHGGHFFLGGKPLDESMLFRQQLRDFWKNYRVVEPEFPSFRTVPETEWETCVPLAVHGDEGRGKGKSPIMVVTVQVIMPLDGEKTNMKGILSKLNWQYFTFLNYHTFLSRKSIIRNKPFWNKISLKAIHVYSPALHSSPFSIHPEELSSVASTADSRSQFFAGTRGQCHFTACNLFIKKFLGTLQT